MQHQTQPEIKKAVLIGVQLPKISDSELHSSLDELTRLVTTLGYKVVGRLTQKRTSDKSNTVLGEGKLKALGKWTGGTGKIAALFVRKKSKAALKWDEEGEDSLEDEVIASAEVETEEDTASDSTSEITEQADVVIVDTDLSPSQLRNLESASGVPVLDRTGVIIEIFSRHARTKAARLQVEIARLAYVAPRLRESTQGEQQGGGGKGAGETSLELDKRKIRDRIKELKNELESIGNEHDVRRARRGQELSVALVGYTNAGKSSLMRALTGSDILIADKLFATLDTTIRPMYPESKPKVLISDTVGFIKKLPHDLVASFKSTLDEALHASLLLYVVDSSDSSFRSQLQVTQTVLAEVGATEVPHLLVLNKRDNLSAEEEASLIKEFPEAFMLSTHNSDDIEKLRAKILSYFESDMVDADFFIPYTAQQGIIGDVRDKARVLSEAHNDLGTTLHIRVKQEVLASFQERLKKLTQRRL
ncbi:MAG: GTPase HflX [Bdellovibrionaceae bacterium]|nr:GTPase HflX [Pseudobdellovibrionaceae bacterium]